MKRRALIVFWTVATLAVRWETRLVCVAIAALALGVYALDQDQSLWIAPFLIPIAAAVGAAAAGSAIAGSAAVIAVLGTTGAAILGAVVSGIITLAGALLAQALTPTGSRSSAAQGGLRLQEENPHPALRYRFGEFRTQGQVVFRHVTGGHLVMTILFNAARSEEISRLWINETLELELSDTDMANALDFDSKGASFGKPYNDRLLRIWIGLGDQTGVPSDFLNGTVPGLLAAYPDLATASWSGCTVLHVHARFGLQSMAQSRWWAGQPKFEVLGKWTKVYDPRRDPALPYGGSPGGTHDPDDPTTWEYTADDGTEIGANPALVALFLLRNERVLARRDEQILIDMFVDAADDCEVTGESAGRSYTKTIDFSSDGETVGTFIASCTPADLGNDYAIISVNGEASLSIGSYEISVDGGTSITVRSVVQTGLGNTLMEVVPTSLSFTAQSVTFSRPDQGTVKRIAGTDPGSGILAYDKGTMAVSGGELSVTVDGNGEARFGIYFDLSEIGIDPDATYSFDVLGVLSGAGTVTETYATAAAGANPAATSADQLAYSMPPDATGIAVEETGAALDAATVSGRYIAWTFELSANNTVDSLTFNIVEDASDRVRFRCDGTVEVNARDYGLLDGVLDSMGGHLDTSGGRIGIRAGVWKAATGALTVPVGDGFETVDRTDPGFDEMVAVYISRAADYTETETQPYTIGVGQRRQELNLSMVRESEQAARLVQVAAERLRKNRSLQGVWSGREWTHRVGERVTTAYDWWPDANGTWMIISEKTIAAEVEDGLVIHKEMLLVEDEEATYSWDSDSWAGELVVGPVKVPPPSVDAPTIAAEQRDYRTVDGTSRATLKITVGHDDEMGGVRVEVSADGGGYTFLAQQSSEDTSITVYLDPAIVGVTYTARARREDGSFGVSDWVVSDPVKIVSPALDYASADYSAEYT